ETLIMSREADGCSQVAHYGYIRTAWLGPRTIVRDWVSGRAVVDRCPVHVHDLAAAKDEFPLGQEITKQHGHRTTMAVPLMRENEAVGCILIRRLLVQDFSDGQIALLRTFADQAVIAIENTRLFAEIAQKSR